MSLSDLSGTGHWTVRGGQYGRAFLKRWPERRNYMKPYYYDGTAELNSVPEINAIIQYNDRTLLAHFQSFYKEIQIVNSTIILLVI